MAATYPELFAAGIPYSGTPAGCFYSQSGGVDAWNSSCASGQIHSTPQVWAGVSIVLLTFEVALLLQTLTPGRWLRICTRATPAPIRRCRSIMAALILPCIHPTTTRRSSNGLGSLASTIPSQIQLLPARRRAATPLIVGAARSSCRASTPMELATLSRFEAVTT